MAIAKPTYESINVNCRTCRPWPSVTVTFYRRSRIMRRNCDSIAYTKRSPPTRSPVDSRGTDFRASACRTREISVIKSAHAAWYYSSLANRSSRRATWEPSGPRYFETSSHRIDRLTWRLPVRLRETNDSCLQNTAWCRWRLANRTRK